MPEMNGYEATKAIRAMNDRPDGKNIPIIAMTATSIMQKEKHVTGITGRMSEMSIAHILSNA